MRLPFDRLITPTLLRRFEIEADMEEGDGRYYAVLFADNGNLVAHHPVGPSALPHQLIWAAALLKLLNTEIHHDGAWVLCFTHPQPTDFQSVPHLTGHYDYQRYCVIWIDRDGDPQFTSDWCAGAYSELRTFAQVVEAGIFSTAEKLEGAWQTWNWQRDVLDLKQDQTVKAAQGQARTPVLPYVESPPPVPVAPTRRTRTH